MRTKAAFLVGGAVGYVLGTRAGREQFEKIRSSARTVWEDPRVQETVTDVESRAGEFVKDKAPELKEKVTGAVKSAGDTVRSKKSGSDDDLAASTDTSVNGTSTNGTAGSSTP